MADPCKELARLRKEKGLTLKALAELAGTEPDYIGALEHGKLPGLGVASKLARVLDVPFEVLWFKHDKREPLTDIKAGEEYEKICRRFVDFPGLEKLNLSPRASKVLFGANIETLGELLQLSDKELSKIKGLGRACFHEIKAKLAEYGVI